MSSRPALVRSMMSPSSAIGSSLRLAMPLLLSSIRSSSCRRLGMLRDFHNSAAAAAPRASVRTAPREPQRREETHVGGHRPPERTSYITKGHAVLYAALYVDERRRKVRADVEKIFAENERRKFRADVEKILAENERRRKVRADVKKIPGEDI